MRMLQLGDTHLGARRRLWNAPSGWSRADDHLAALEAALAPALHGEVDLVVHTGDLFDRSRPPARAIDGACRLFRQVARRAPLVLLAGNHDRHGLRPSLGGGGGNLHVVDTPTRLSVAGLVLALVPHRRRAEEWAVAARQAVGCGVDLLITHQGFAGARVPGFTFQVGRPAETVDARHLPSGVPLVLSGHLHPRQVVRCGGTPVVYAGSTERTSFSERHQTKGTVRWIDGRWRFDDLPTRPMVVLQDADDLSDIRPGTLVGMAPERLRSWARPAAALGGIVALPPKPRPSRQQLGLFTPSPPA
ncbi:MAG: exonuclease SbcD [Myxococcota bacterium]|jgi:exonuclease SbcD